MSPRLRLIAPLVLLALVATALSAPAVQAAHRSASKHKVGFSTPTVVDNFRPGFEPDLGVDVSPKGKDTTYVSYPFGFSTTQSIIYRSDDHRKSFHLIEGNVDGKPGSCAGGGDSEIKIDPISGDMYFVDLQGLTNFSASTSTDKGATFSTSCNSVNGVAVDRQWLGIDTNGGKSAVAAGADGGRLYLDYDNVGQDTGNGGNNQLVMNESLDGVHYGSGCQAAGAPCPGVPAVASPDEGIPGNIVVDNQPANQGDAFVHRVYAIHTNSSSSGVIVSYCSGAPGDDTAAKVAASCTDPTQVTADPSHVNIYWHDSFVRPAGSYGTGYLFAAMAVDSAGNLYAVWSEYPQSGGSPSGPGIVKLAVSTDGAKTWSDPIDVSPPTLGNNVMPWVAAGDPGRIDIAWYGAPQAKGPSGDFGPDTLDQGTWNVYMAQSLNALAAQPKFKLTKVTDHQTKFGNISTQGLGGSPDRSLGDFMQVQVGKKGQAILSYVDDTSADRNPDFCGGCGQTPAEAAGPIMIATQNRGASLFNSVRKVTGPKRAVNKVRDKKGDGAFYGGGTSMPATPSMDLRGASIKMAGAKHIKVTLKTADKTLANDLMVDPSLGGTVGEWLVRWAAPVYKGKPGDGNIFYTGMESAAGGAPEFYTGTTAAIQTTHAKYFVYPKSKTIPGKIKKNKIIWTVPLSAIGKPKPRQGLFGVTGFTVTQTAPSTTDTNGAPNGSSAGQIPNTIDLTPPFTFKIHKARRHHTMSRMAHPELGLALVLLVGLGLGGLYSRRRHALHDVL